MKNNPLIVICIFFCLGIWMATLVHIPLFFAFACAFLFLLSALLNLKRNFWSFLSLGLCVFFIGILHFQNSRIYPAGHISNYISNQPQEVYLRGRVVSPPEVAQTFYQTRKTSFILRSNDLKLLNKEKWQLVRGLVKVTLYGERGNAEDRTEVQYGDELLLEGVLKRPPGLRNPGGFDYRRYLASHNIFGLLKAKENDVCLSPGGRSPNEMRNGLRLGWETVLKEVYRFKRRMQETIYRHLESEQAALLSAVLLGERSGLSRQTEDMFMQSGTIHLLAISGLHVGLIALILIALFRLIRLPRRWTFILTIVLLIGYVLLSGARPSVVRAVIMADIVLFGLLINREPKIYNSLALAALIILIYNPLNLFNPGFQLSFLSVLSIVYFGPKIQKLFPVHNRWLSYLAAAFSVSLAVWIGIAPVIAFHFNIVSPITILANLLAVPLLFLIAASGITFLFFASLCAGLGGIFAQTSWLTLIALTKLTALMAEIPFGFFHCFRPGIYFLTGYYGIVLLGFNYRRIKIPTGRFVLICAVLANILVWKPLLAGGPERLRVTFLDVGGADAIFVEFPGQGAMLVDGGKGMESDDGRRVVLPFLWSRGRDAIDAVVLTHADEDHVGGLASVLDNVRVNYLFDNGRPKHSETYYRYKKSAGKVPGYHLLKKGEEICGFPGVRLSVLHPARDFKPRRKMLNNSSLVLQLCYKNVSFIFCADIQAEGMRELLASAIPLGSNVLKVPHHGGYEGRIGEDLFNQIGAEIAVISTADKRLQVSRDLRNAGTRVYSTCDYGAVTVETDGRQIRVETMIKPEGT